MEVVLISLEKRLGLGTRAKVRNAKAPSSDRDVTVTEY